MTTRLLDSLPRVIEYTHQVQSRDPAGKFFVGLGTFALVLALSVFISSLFKSHMSDRAWRSKVLVPTT